MTYDEDAPGNVEDLGDMRATYRDNIVCTQPTSESESESGSESGSESESESENESESESESQIFKTKIDGNILRQMAAIRTGTAGKAKNR
jgi:U3 small nucleolar RNA-associated protein 14